MVSQFCFGTILFLLTACFAVADEAYNDSFGCEAFSYNSSSSCLVKNVEVLPAISLPLGGQITATTPAECQKLCAETPDCAYFTHIGSQSTCILKPALSYAASPIMTVRQKPAGDYVSGPRTCDLACEDLPEVAPGCGPSTPASCGMLAGEPAFFDPNCKDGDCGVQGYKCCRSCALSKSDCCVGYEDGQVLQGGKALKSHAIGIESPNHCKTLCHATPECTSWNFIASPTTALIGGACYLKANADDLKLAAAAASVKSTTGKTSCTLGAGDEECLVKGTRRDNDITVAYDILDLEVCRSWCQKVPGCTSIDFKPHLCALKYGQPAAREDDKTEVSHAARSCDGAPPATEKCIDPEMEYEGKTAGLSGYRSTADICRDNAQGLAGWSYSKSSCTLFVNITGNKKNSAAISGTPCNDNKWPGMQRISPAVNNAASGATRVLSQLSDELPTECVLSDQSVVGGFIENIASIDALSTCMSICLFRPDCKSVTYAAATRVCSLHWSVKLAYKEGVVSSLRSCKPTCEEGACPETIQIGNAPVAGLTQVSLGSFASWNVRGSSIEFNAPSVWKRIAVLILADKDSTDCYISDLVNAPMNCWNERQNVLPIHFKAQIVVVPAGSIFHGWDQHTWEQAPSSIQDSTGMLVLLNEDITIEEENKPNSDHGFFLKENPAAAVTYWPTDLTTPVDFANGKVYARFLVLSSPVPTSVKVIVCVTQSDDPPREICSPSVSLPPYNE